jgi:hypothetical protein
MPKKLSFDKAKSMIDELHQHPELSNNVDIKSLLQSLQNEIDHLHHEFNDCSGSAPSLNVPRLDANTNCYLFENKEGYFCTNCFDTKKQLVKTKRLNSKLRVCPSCRASISPDNPL